MHSDRSNLEVEMQRAITLRAQEPLHFNLNEAIQHHESALKGMNPLSRIFTKFKLLGCLNALFANSHDPETQGQKIKELSSYVDSDNERINIHGMSQDPHGTTYVFIISPALNTYQLQCFKIQKPEELMTSQNQDGKNSYLHSHEHQEHSISFITRNRDTQELKFNHLTPDGTSSVTLDSIQYSGCGYVVGYRDSSQHMFVFKDGKLKDINLDGYTIEAGERFHSINARFESFVLLDNIPVRHGDDLARVAKLLRSRDAIAIEK